MQGYVLLVRRWSPSRYELHVKNEATNSTILKLLCVSKPHIYTTLVKSWGSYWLCTVSTHTFKKDSCPLRTKLEHTCTIHLRAAMINIPQAIFLVKFCQCEWPCLCHQNCMLPHALRFSSLVQLEQEHSQEDYWTPLHLIASYSCIEESCHMNHVLQYDSVPRLSYRYGRCLMEIYTNVGWLIEYYCMSWTSLTCARWRYSSLKRQSS